MEHTEKKEKSSKQKIAKLEKQIANSEEILIALNTKRQKIKESYDKKIEKLKKEQTEKLEAKDKEIAELSDSIAKLEASKEEAMFQEFYRSIKEQGVTAENLLSAVKNDRFVDAMRESHETNVLPVETSTENLLVDENNEKENFSENFNVANDDE